MAFIFSYIGALAFCRLMTSKCVLKQTVKIKNAVFYHSLLYSLKPPQSSEIGKPFYGVGRGNYNMLVTCYNPPSLLNINIEPSNYILNETSKPPIKIFSNISAYILRVRALVHFRLDE